MMEQVVTARPLEEYDGSGKFTLTYVGSMGDQVRVTFRIEDSPFGFVLGEARFQASARYPTLVMLERDDVFPMLWEGQGEPMQRPPWVDATFTQVVAAFATCMRVSAPSRAVVDALPDDPYVPVVQEKPAVVHVAGKGTRPGGRQPRRRWGK